MPQKSTYLDNSGNPTKYLNEDGVEIPPYDTFVGPENPADPNVFTGPVDDRSLLTRMSDSVNTFARNHPTLRRLTQETFTGTSPEKTAADVAHYTEQWNKNPELQKQYPNVRSYLEIATKPTNEFSKIPGTDKLSESIRNRGINTGNYWGGFFGDLASQLTDLAGTLDPRVAAGIKGGQNPQIAERAALQKRLDTIANDTTVYPLEVPERQILREQPYPLNVVPRNLHPDSLPVLRPMEQEAPQVLDRFGVSPKEQPYPLNVVPRRLHPSNQYFESMVPSAIREKVPERGIELDTAGKVPESPNVNQPYPLNVLPEELQSSTLRKLEPVISKEAPKVEESTFDSIQKKAQDVLDRILNNEKGAIGDQSGPKNLKELQENPRLKKLLTDETGALTLRGWKRNQVDELRSNVLNDLASQDRLDLNSVHEKYKSTVSKSQFEKIVDDIINSGDFENAVRSRLAPKEVEAAPMATADLQEAIDAVVNKVKENIVKRNEQDALVREEKFRRIQNIKALRSQGQQKVFDSLRELKGQYPKVDAGDIAGGINPADVDAIHNLIDLQSNLDIFQKLNAKIAVSKAMGTMRRAGALQPSEIALLEKIFGSEVTDELKQMHSALGFMIPDGSTIGERLTKAGELSKTMASGGDIGWMFRQGINYAGRKTWFKSLAPSVKAYFSPSVAERELQAIRDSKFYQLAEESGLAISDYKALDANLREETNPSKFFEELERKGKLGKIAATPFTGSNRSMTVGLDKLRMGEFTRKVEAYQKLYESALKDAGTDAMKIKEAERLNPQQPWLAERIADEINTATGRGKMPRLLKGSERALNAAMFSPRLLASRLRSINRILNPVSYWKYDRIQRIDALKQLLSIGVVTGSTLALGKALGGETNGNITTSDFLKSKIGNLRLEGTGGYVPLIVAAARLATGATTDTDGDIHRLGDFGYRSGLQVAEDALFNNRLSPLGSLITALLNREEFGGRKLNFKSSNPMENTVMRQFVPLLLRDIWDIAREDPDLLVGLTAGVGSSLGIGAQVYSNQPREKKPKLQLNKLGPLSWPSESGSTEDPEVFGVTTLEKE